MSGSDNERPAVGIGREQRFDVDVGGVRGSAG